jgi:DNA-binding PadR family transcriptional regulator
VVVKSDILEIVRRNPGATGFMIHDSLRAKSRAARLFGRRSVLVWILGPSVGIMYVMLAALERDGALTSVWGAPRRGKHRPRQYYLSGTAAAR